MMFRIGIKKYIVNIVLLSLIIMIFSSFFVHSTVLAKEIDNNKKDILYSKRDSTWSKIKKYLLSGVATYLVINLVNMLNKDKDDTSEEIDPTLPSVYLIGSMSKKPILESLKLIDENYKFEEINMENFKINGSNDKTNKQINIFSMPSKGTVAYTTKFMIDNFDALNIISIDLDLNENEITEEIVFWKNIILSSTVNSKRTMFLLVYRGKNADGNKVNKILDILYMYGINLDILEPSYFLISKDKDVKQGKNLKENILRVLTER